MGNYEELKQAVSNVIKTNGNQEITGAIMQNTLLSIISTVGNNATFAGIANPTTNPGTPDQNVFYLATEPGIYTNFGNEELKDQIVIFTNKNGSWEKQEAGIVNSVKVNAMNDMLLYVEYLFQQYGIIIGEKLFTEKKVYTNDGLPITSRNYLSTKVMKVYDGLEKYLTLKNVNNGNYYNIFLCWKEDPEIAGYEGENKVYNVQVTPNDTDIKRYIDKGEFKYFVITLPVDNVNEYTFGSFGNYVEKENEKNEYISFLLGSLINRTNLIYNQMDGYHIVNGKLTTAGGSNSNTYVVKVENGKTYYFYKKNGTQIEEYNVNWLTTGKNGYQSGYSSSIRSGQANNVTIQDGEYYLYISASKTYEIMISSEVQTMWYDKDNTTFLDVQRLISENVNLENRVEELENKENQENLSFYQLEKKKSVYDYSGGIYIVSNASKSSLISDYTDYKADNGGNLNSIFRYSSKECKIDTELYPYYLVKEDRTPSWGFCVEFDCDASEIEWIGFTSYYACIIIDGEFVNSQNGILSGVNYIHINLGSVKKRHFKIFTKSKSFAGVRCKNDGTIIQFKEDRFVCAFDGDSVVEGSNASYLYSKWIEIVSNKLNFDSLNTAMGGTGYIKTLNERQNMVDRFANQIAQYNPDILVVSAGINDPNEESEFEQAVDNYYSQAIELLPNCRIIICSNYFNKPSDDPRITNAEMKCEVLRKIALKYNIPFIDYLHRLTYDGLGNLITNNIGTSVNTNLITNENYSEFIDAETDITHPTQYGHNIMGQYIGNEVYKVIKNIYGFIE